MGPAAEEQSVRSSEMVLYNETPRVAAKPPKADRRWEVKRAGRSGRGTTQERMTRHKARRATPGQAHGADRTSKRGQTTSCKKLEEWKHRKERRQKVCKTT